MAQLPAASAVIAPVLAFTEQMLGVVVAKVTAPVPLPPVAAANKPA